MSVPAQKQHVHIVVRFEIEGVENAEQSAVDWLNAVLINAPRVAGIEPRLPIVTFAEHEQQARQVFGKLVEILEAHGQIVPDAFRKVKEGEVKSGNPWFRGAVHGAENYLCFGDGRALFMIENVPARVSETTGEQLFSPATVERLQQMVRAKQKPVRILETPVYEFAA
jgi:hypothetical protein